MHKKLFRTAVITVVMITVVCMNVLAQDQLPVRIVFDQNSERIDIATGNKMPNYTQAQRGSFIFYEGKFDSPTDHLNFMFSTMVSTNIKDIVLIRKIHAQNVWALSGTRYKDVVIADIVKEYMVSFIPINPDTRKPDRRVYILLDDMNIIQWADVNHWAATKSQAEYESEEGAVY